MHQPHTAPMRAQVQNEHAASTNRAQFASANHGRPANVAVNQPLAADHNVKAPPALQTTNRNVEQQQQQQHRQAPQQATAPGGSTTATAPGSLRNSNNVRRLRNSNNARRHRNSSRRLRNRNARDSAATAPSDSQPQRQAAPQPQQRQAAPQQQQHQAAPQPQQRQAAPPQQQRQAAPQPQHARRRHNSSTPGSSATAATAPGGATAATTPGGSATRGGTPQAVALLQGIRGGFRGCLPQWARLHHAAGQQPRPVGAAGRPHSPAHCLPQLSRCFGVCTKVAAFENTRRSPTRLDLCALEESEHLEGDMNRLPRFAFGCRSPLRLLFAWQSARTRRVRSFPTVSAAVAGAQDQAPPTRGRIPLR